MSHYDSDGSTLVNEAHQQQRRRRSRGGGGGGGESRRPRSPSVDSRPRYQARNSHSYSYDNNYGYDGAPPYPTTTNKSSTQDFASKYATVGKVAVLVGIVGVLLHKWQKEKEAQRRRQERREREERHRRRKDFDRRKRERRREEERREREDEEVGGVDSPVAEVRRIEYSPLEGVRSRSRSRSRSSSASSGERRRVDDVAGGRGGGRGERARSRYGD